LLAEERDLKMVGGLYLEGCLLGESAMTPSSVSWPLDKHLCELQTSYTRAKEWQQFITTNIRSRWLTPAMFQVKKTEMILGTNI
jgi:hypothetical protein